MTDKEQLDIQPTKKNPGELFFLSVLFIIMAAFLVESLKLEGLIQGATSGPGTIPQAVSIFVLGLICLVFAQHFKARYKEGRIIEIVQYLFCKEVVILLALVAAYALLLETLHFEIITFLFLYIGMMMLATKRKPVQKLVISAGSLGVIIVVFKYLFQVILP